MTKRRAEERDDAAFNAVVGAYVLSNEKEQRLVVDNIAAQKKLACEYEVESGKSRLHVSASARFTRVSAISL